jgi:hypothetical protein
MSCWNSPRKERDDKHKILSQELKGRELLEDLNIDVRIILKWIPNGI